MSSSSSGRHINGKWIPSNQPMAKLSTIPSQPQKVRRRPYTSKTRRPGIQEAIKAAFEAGNTTLEEVKKEIEKEGFYLGIESIRKIRIEEEIPSHYQARAKVGLAENRTCIPNATWEDKK